MGTATGKPAAVDSLVVRNSPERSATSVDVPPMSKVMTLSMPANSAAYAAPVTPPAGPDKIVVTGSRAAFAAEITPPLDCIKYTRAVVVAVLGRGPLYHAVRARFCVPRK